MQRMSLPKAVSLSLFLHNIFVMVSCKVIDMSYPYEDNMVTWPGLLPFSHTLVHKGAILKVPFLLHFNIKLNEHTGTHIDAPAHFVEGGTTVDEISAESLIGEAIVVNITNQASRDPDYQLSVDDLKDWELKHGKIPDGSIVFVLTGYGKYWGNFEKYFGTNKTNLTDIHETPTFHWPGFHKEAAQWLVDNRKIKGVGLDSRSLDPGNSETLPAHHVFLGNNIYGLESVANIEKLPARGTIVYVMPMKIKGGSGGPTRIIAQTSELEAKVEPVGECSLCTSNIVLLIMSILLAIII